MSKAQIDILVRGVAKRYGHHGVQTVVESLRQKYNVAVDPEYVRELLK